MDWVIKKGDKLEIVGYSTAPTHLSRDGWTVVGIAPKNATHAEDLIIITETDEFGGELERIVIDEVKRQARLDREAQEEAELSRNTKLAELRKQRDKKLEKADNQIKKHEDSDPNATATAADWKTHRIVLRDLTASYKDAQDDTKGTAALDSYAQDMSDFDQWPIEPS